MSDFKAKLKRMGVVKGAKNLKPVPKPADPFSGSGPRKKEETLEILAELFPNGRVVSDYEQPYFEVDAVFPLTHKVGPSVLADVANLDLSPAAEFTGDERLQGMTGRDLLFVDLETTGLAGSGVQPFMIGLAFFEGDALVVRQYFMHKPAAEEGMLQAFDQLFAKYKALVTFNGKTFDLPVLDTRFIMTGLMDGSRPDLVKMPHLDLLSPARRIWSYLPSRALSYLDEHVLKMKRPPGEIPGRLAPWLYNQFAHSGDPRPLEGMFLHNELDMLAMVPLVEQIVNYWSADLLPENPYIALSLCRWKLALDQHHSAELMLADYLSRGDELPVEPRLIALRELSLMLKKQDRRPDAVPLWQEMAELDQIEDVFPHLELAKYYEWHAVDLEKASMWSAHAYQIVIARPALDFGLKDEIEHRLRRLADKIERAS